MILLCFVSHPMIAVLFPEEINENANNGNPSPNPKPRKLVIPDKNCVVVAALAKNAAIKAGLQGKTIAPKKNPNEKALTKGFLESFGVLAFGMNLPKSTSNIKSKLITNKIPKAIGETIFITLVSDAWNKVVKTMPIKSMNAMTPSVAINPNRA